MPRTWRNRTLALLTLTLTESYPPPSPNPTPDPIQNLADTESMLLVEFAGETGHGTGPTLEASNVSVYIS